MPRPRPVTPTAAASSRPPRAAARPAPARALAGLLALALAPGSAQASASGLVEGSASRSAQGAGSGLSDPVVADEATGAKNLSEETATPPGPAAMSDPVVADEGTAEPPAASAAATRWTAEAQRARVRGDLDAAIAGWQRALASLPVTQATAHRRAGLALAIAAAHAEAATARADPQRLRAAIATLDAYLAGLDPTDDENRVAVEQRRAELVARQVSPPGPGVAPPASPRRDRRLLIAGGATVGLAAVGAAILGVGLVSGLRADAALADAVARPGDDPDREAAKADALSRGLRGNQLAIAGGVLGGALLAAGLTLLIVGATRRPAGDTRLGPGPGGLRWRF